MATTAFGYTTNAAEAYDEKGYSVTNKALTSNVATLTVGAHTVVVGERVNVSGVDAVFNGSYLVTAVTGTTLSYAKTNANVTSAAATGAVQVDNRTNSVGWTVQQATRVLDDKRPVAADTTGSAYDAGVGAVKTVV